MKYTIDTDVLDKYNISVDDFLWMWAQARNVNTNTKNQKVLDMNIGIRMFNKRYFMVSPSAFNFIDSLLICSESEGMLPENDELDSLIERLQSLFPLGLKEGTTLHWRGNKTDIKMRLLIASKEYDFDLRDTERIFEVTKQYVDSNEDPTYMRVLENFILRIDNDLPESELATYIENQ